MYLNSPNDTFDDVYYSNKITQGTSARRSFGPESNSQAFQNHESGFFLKEVMGDERKTLNNVKMNNTASVREKSQNSSKLKREEGNKHQIKIHKNLGNVLKNVNKFEIVKISTRKVEEYANQVRFTLLSINL